MSNLYLIWFFYVHLFFFAYASQGYFLYEISIFDFLSDFILFVWA